MITRREARDFLTRCGLISKPLFLMDMRAGYAVTAELGRIKAGHFAGYFLLSIHEGNTPKFTPTPETAFHFVQSSILSKKGVVITTWESPKRYNIIFAVPKQRKGLGL